MTRRLRVLISAYACEPGKGSEPEVGWQWALQMARFHDVTVLTRANNRENIEQGLAALQGQQPLPQFVYHEETHFLLKLKQGLGGLKLYYTLWQHSARNVVAKLHAEHRFDLLHHVTFAGFRYPTVIWGHGVPCIWGPIGGIESVPWALLPWTQPGAFLEEVKRNFHNWLQSALLQILPKRAQASTVILASTPEMRQTFIGMGRQATLMSTIGLKTQALPYQSRNAHEGPLRLLFVGNIITLKGIDLALKALKASRTNAVFTLIGDGSYLSAARRLVQKLGLGKQVFFPGRMARDAVLQRYAEFDVFMFPSLHDTGGYAVIEAMLNELPVICLDCGGPALAVQEGCGIKVSLDFKSKVIAQLAAAIKEYDGDRQLLRTHGNAARAMILRNYDWDKKGEQMNEIYQRIATQEREGRPTGYTGISNTVKIMHRMISVKRRLVTFLGVILVGALGFLGLSYLKGVVHLIAHGGVSEISLAGPGWADLADASRTVMFIILDDKQQCVQIPKKIDGLNEWITDYLKKYEEGVNSTEGRWLFNLLGTERKKRIQIRNQILDLATVGRRGGTTAQYNQVLVTTLGRGKTTKEELSKYDIKHGEASSRNITIACTVTQITVALIGVLVFTLGFLYDCSGKYFPQPA